MALLTAHTVVSWHGQTTQEHDALADAWAAKGFRSLSLSVYGAPDSPRYAAVLVKRPTVIAVRSFYSLSQRAMQDVFDAQVRDGYGPFILTATGPGDGAVFAGSFTPMAAIPLTRLNVSAGHFAELNFEQQAAGHILLWADAFGTPDDPRYTAIWARNPDRVAWNADAVDEGGDDHQQRFAAVYATGGRPAVVSVTPAGRMAEAYVDADIGPFHSQRGMTGAEFTAAAAAQKAKGRMPLRVSASGEGGSVRFAAVFATRDDPLPRTFRSQGPRAVAAVDAAAESAVRARNLRGVAFAVVKGPRLVYARGYTFAEADYPDVLPTTRHRQASVSKLFTAAAIWRLIQQGDLALDMPVQAVLHLTRRDGAPPRAPHFGEITVRHLLESRSGIDQDLVHQGVDAAAAAGAPLPCTHRLLLAHIADSPRLTARPGTPTNVHYGHTDYFLLSAVVTAKAKAATFEAALASLVLGRLHITRTRTSRTLVEDQADDEARYHATVFDPDNRYTPFSLARSVKSDARPLVATQYGGDDLELYDGAGGLSAAAVDVARLAAMLSARAHNPLLSAATLDRWLAAAAEATHTLSSPDPHDAHGYHGFDGCTAADASHHVYQAAKGGSLPAVGVSLQITTGADGLTYLWTQNGNSPPDSPNWLDAVRPAVEAHAWPDDDLFPHYGMPSFGA